MSTSAAIRRTRDNDQVAVPPIDEGRRQTALASNQPDEILDEMRDYSSYA